MYYDCIYNKMIPGVFILINNKTISGYLEIFEVLKKNILEQIGHNINKMENID